MKIIENDCISCGNCLELCPQEAIQPKITNTGGYACYEINKDLCIDCGICLENDCPGNAIQCD